MGRKAEMLEAGMEARCEGCAYRLDGLPMKGACPECGTKYKFERLYVRKQLSGERCEGCSYALKGLPLRGTCPECGAGYWFDRPKRERPWKGAGDHVAGVWAWLAERLTGAWMGIFIVIVVAALAVVAWRAYVRIDRVFIQEQRWY